MQMSASRGQLGEEPLSAAAGGSAMRVDSARNFENLIRPLLSSAYGLAYSILGDRPSAEDAVQESVAKAWRGIHRMRKGASLRAWFFTIVANQCRDARRASRRTVLSLFEIPEPTVTDHADVVARDLDLERALARLSPKQRALLFLRYQMDMPPAEMATVLGWPAGTVKSRLHRALRELEADMSEGGPTTKHGH
jgi:RNA polymerase sigma-70 factor, ECF subfamily